MEYTLDEMKKVANGGCYEPGEQLGIIQQLLDERAELLLALEAITSNEFVDLDAIVYQVREREGEGWKGKWVSQWGDAVKKVNEVIAKARSL